jgi:hypothetical protein
MLYVFFMDHCRYTGDVGLDGNSGNSGDANNSSSSGILNADGVPINSVINGKHCVQSSVYYDDVLYCIL